MMNAAGKEKIFIHLTGGNECYDYLKIKAPLMALGQELWEEGISFYPSEELTAHLVNQFNVFVFHGVGLGNMYRQLQRLKDKRIIWFIDDLMTQTPSWNPAHNRLNYSKIESYKSCLERADLICCTTERLKEFTISEGDPSWKDKTIVLPNLLDMKRFPEYSPKQFKRFGWCGGNTHFGDIRILEPMVKSRYKEFIFFDRRCY